IFAAIVVLALLTTAAADEWSYEDLGVPIAYIDNGVAQLQFACRGGDLAMGFWVRSPHREVAGATAMSLAIAPDTDAGTATAPPPGSSFAQDIPLIHNDGSSAIVRGPVARQWARIAQRARKVLHLAYVRTTAPGRFELFDA